MGILHDRAKADVRALREIARSNSPFRARAQSILILRFSGLGKDEDTLPEVKHDPINADLLRHLWGMTESKNVDPKEYEHIPKYARTPVWVALRRLSDR